MVKIRLRRMGAKKVFPLLGGHGKDDGFGAGKALFVHLCALERLCVHSGDHPRKIV